MKKFPIFMTKTTAATRKDMKFKISVNFDRSNDIRKFATLTLNFRRKFNRW